MTRDLIIDVHAHAPMPLYHRLVQQTSELGPDQRFGWRTFLPPRLPEWSPERALELMDRTGIDAQVLSLPDATVELRGETARRFARQINEAMAEIVAAHPGKFAAFAVLPHDDADSTLAEIAYALDVLKLDGICTTANIRGTYLGDPSFDPWMDELHRRAAVLFVHPTLSADAPAPAPRFIEFCFDSSRMVINMVLTGARQKFSGIRVISTHGGGTIPYVSHRLEELVPLLMPTRATKESIAGDLRSFYYDLTSCMGHVPLLAATQFVAASHLLLGFDFPYAPTESLKPELDRFLAFADLSAADRSVIASTSALDLFPRLRRV